MLCIFCAVTFGMIIKEYLDFAAFDDSSLNYGHKLFEFFLRIFVIVSGASVCLRGSRIPCVSIPSMKPYISVRTDKYGGSGGIGG